MRTLESTSLAAARRLWTFCHSSEDTTFPDSFDDALLASSAPCDQRIARLLWIWSRQPTQVLDDGRNVEQHLAGLLERFLCDAFTYCREGSKQGWWSDGVVDLHIDRFTSTAFLLFGSTWWTGRHDNEFWMGPFEIEFYFDVEGELDVARTIVRFGRADNHGNIVRSSMCLHPRIRNDGRPSQDSVWAMAIELTPPENT